MGIWSRSFEGKPEAVGEARRFARAVLDGHPAADDVALIVTEFGANAIKHTASAGPGGLFLLEVERCEEHVQVAVADMGAATEPTLSAAHRASLVAASGRGLVLVAALAVKWGSEQTRDGRRVWAIVGAGQPGDGGGGGGGEEEEGLDHIGQTLG